MRCEAACFDMAVNDANTTTLVRLIAILLVLTICLTISDNIRSCMHCLAHFRQQHMVIVRAMRFASACAPARMCLGTFLRA